ncbi:MAG: VOC family protein [Anaerolineales bacterium]|nr:VOC family protein [Anaerolineales bacterium]
MIEIGRLHHCTIVVRDLAASRQFYVDVLGMEQVQRPQTFDFPGQWFRKNGYEIHTLHDSFSQQLAGDPPRSPANEVPNNRHICFSILNVDAALAGLAANNIPIAAGPRDRGDGATQIYIYDPDGHLIELVHEPWG